MLGFEDTMLSSNWERMSSRRPKAIARGDIWFGKVVVDGYVLDDGRRVLSQRGVLRALGAGTTGGLDLVRRLRRLPRRYAYLLSVPGVTFDLPGGGVAIGREAQFLVDVCYAYCDAGMAGLLHRSQIPAASAALDILCSRGRTTKMLAPSSLTTGAVSLAPTAPQSSSCGSQGRAA
jgi:hypothetical protein